MVLLRSQSAKGLEGRFTKVSREREYRAISTRIVAFTKCIFFQQSGWFPLSLLIFFLPSFIDS